MNNWKVVSQITSLSGIVLIIFSVITAILNYQAIIIQYSTLYVPMSYFIISIISSMLPYLMLTFIAFITAIISSRAAKEISTTTPTLTETINT